MPGEHCSDCQTRHLRKWASREWLCFVGGTRWIAGGLVDGWNGMEKDGMGQAEW